MQSETLFVIGAGASFEIGLPLGRDLKNKISYLLRIKHDKFGSLEAGNQTMLRNLMNVPGEETHLILQKCNEIANAIHYFDSIDDLIDSRSDDAQFAFLGKIAIVHAILTAEKNSILSIDENSEQIDFEIFRRKLEHPKYSDSYLPRLWSLISNRIKRDDLDSIFDGLSFITFNYDRCLEHFLYLAVRIGYGVSKTVAAELVKKVPIIHPYGAVGRLPWQYSSSKQIAFGAEPLDLLALAPNIKTYTERFEGDDMLTDIRSRLQQADTIVFLGMAYHEQNMNLLRLEDMDGTRAHRIFGTVYGLSESHQVISRKLIERTLGRSKQDFGWLRLHPVSCAHLLDEYGKLLSYNHLSDIVA